MVRDSGYVEKGRASDLNSWKEKGSVANLLLNQKSVWALPDFLMCFLWVVVFSWPGVRSPKLGFLWINEEGFIKQMDVTAP